MAINSNNSLYFKDPKVQIIVDNFLKKSKSDGFHNMKFQDALKVIELLPKELDSTSINWGLFQELFDKSLNESIRYNMCRFISEFIKNDCYNGDYIEIVETFKNVKVLGKELYWLFSHYLLPFNLIVIKKPSSKNSLKTKDMISNFRNDSSNLYLSRLLRDFAINNITGSKLKYPFYSNFQKSLKGKMITHITDFNSETFRHQFYYFKDKENSVFSLIMLKKFYLMLLELPEGKNILHWKDGIDKNMLKTVSFNKNYEEGFIPIPLNPFDPVPQFDKWLVMPNGAETKSTKINSFTYKPIDFSLVEDDKLKNCLKDWFWNSNISLMARIDHANICMKFINYICELRDKYSIKKFSISDEDSVSVEEIFSYVQLVKSNDMNSNYISAIRGFLTYLQEKNLYNVEPSIFKYLVTKSAKVKTSPKDISDENLIKLDAKLKENAQNHYLNTLYYIIFHIAIATEFRISQIINLKIDCLVKGVKKDYYLKSNTKVSNGEDVTVPITPFTRRYIETAISYTQHVRDECKDNAIKEHIFIHNHTTFSFKIVTVRTFSDYLKRTCSELGIEKFTAQNLRDTYMTKSIEYAIKNNLSDMEVRALTGHKQISTTNNHYVAKKINDYLEATHMVIIGDPNIKGKVVAETNYKNEDLVNDQCGYCEHESCIQKDSNIDCLMCSGFIATVDRIPFYEAKIKEIDKNIKSTELSAEKERFVTIKRLYLAYLGKLLELKEVT